ncbi:MAG: DUF493 family protein [Elusimicrobia bacterium]|nr:DUF493 family protein [Elusimicrobiota bacterium]
MPDEKSYESLKARLDACTTWPAPYMFKFIVPSGQVGLVIALFQGKPVVIRDSKNGRYISVTAELEMSSSEEVVSLYRKAAKIRGIISL